MKDVKTKPKGTDIPKNKPKTAERSINPMKDIKSVAKDQLIWQKAELKDVSKNQEQQSERPENYATDHVENAVCTTADTAYRTTKDFAQNKIKQHISQVEIKENYTEAHTPNVSDTKQTDLSQQHNVNAPKTADSVNTPKQVNSQENIRVKVKSDLSVKAKEVLDSSSASEIQVKTKENYIRQHTQNADISAPKTVDRRIYRLKKNGKYAAKSEKKIETVEINPNILTPKQQAQKYIKTNLETKARLPKEQSVNVISYVHMKNSSILDTPSQAANILNSQPVKPDILVKTKQNYIQSQQKMKVGNTSTTSAQLSQSTVVKYKSTIPKQKNSEVVSRSAKNLVKPNQQSYFPKSKSIFKANYSAKKKAEKTAKKAVKTQKEITKQAAKQAAKRSAQLAKQAAQAAKQATKAAVKATVKVAQVIAHAVKAIVSAILAFGGWAALLVVLLVIIIVAAIAASPFGIFISDEAADADSIPLSSIVAECNVELSSMLDHIEDSSGANRIVMEGEQADWSEVIALFAVKVAGTNDETSEEVVVITEDKKQKLKDVFWDMNSITSRTETVTAGETTETVLYITINHKTKDDMINEYHFTARQQEALAILLENNDILIVGAQSLAISDGTAQDVIRTLPENLPADRKAVIKAACSLVGKVNYFWGGKSSAIGWDSKWGKMKLVTAEGSKTSGSMRPFGLDCSGFVTWSFLNAGKSANAIGHGTQGQIANCTRIPWSQAQPGDLTFLSDLSHVGIVAGKDASGNILVIHCASSQNNVVITTNSIFGFAARPSCY